ncbi:hypothetical protein, partial [Rhizobium ruizarguesonis]|uniref:hypothetical protein n=1 Tax=Rhizobium ruizarguesonis TaxID=2081791 RepID=UPI001953238B
MKPHNLFLSGVAATVLSLSSVNPAVAQSPPSNEELGRRVDSIEMKLDAIIQMMAKDRPPVSTPTSASSQSSETPQSEVLPADGYQKGLTLDLYL